jgi:chromosome partitioning protein
MARVIAIALPKGGVGKTTTAVNLAASLAVAEQRTLLIDMDTFGASGLSLGFTEGRIGSVRDLQLHHGTCSGSSSDRARVP